MKAYHRETTRIILRQLRAIADQEGCPSCGHGNFPNMPGELCDECQEAAQVRVHPDFMLEAI